MERKFLVLAIIWTVLITGLSLITIKADVSSSLQSKDKLVHFIFYFLFVLFWANSFKTTNKFFFVIILIVAFAYGILIEVMQECFTLNRKAEINDVLANFMGAITAFLLISLKNRKK